MIKMTPVSKELIQKSYRKTKWQAVFEEFEAMDVDVVELTEGGRKPKHIASACGQALANQHKGKVLGVAYTGGKAYLYRRDKIGD